MSEIDKYNPEIELMGVSDKETEEPAMNSPLRTLRLNKELADVSQSREQFNMKQVHEIAQELSARYEHLVRMEEKLKAGDTLTELEVYNMKVENETYKLYREYLDLIKSASVASDERRIGEEFTNLNKEKEKQVSEEAQELLEHQIKILEERYLKPFMELTGSKERLRAKLLESLIDLRLNKNTYYEKAIFNGIFNVIVS